MAADPVDDVPAVEESPSAKPDARPVSYHRQPIAAKRAANIAAVRDPTVICCPSCATTVTPDDLLVHMEQRCPRELPEPSQYARWVKRERALHFAPSSLLERWVELDLLRVRGDGSMLLRDLALLCAWTRALAM